MKKTRFLGLLAAVTLLAGTLTTVPATPAQADRDLEIDPEEGPVGTRVTVTGEEFNKSTADYDKYAAIYISSQEATTLDDIGSDVTTYEMIDDAVWLDEDGDFETSVIIPRRLNDGTDDEDVSSGTYYIYVCHYIGTTVQTRIRAVAEFTVTVGELFLDPLEGTVDSLVEISGTGFNSREEITIEFDDSSIPIYSGSEKTNSSGEFTSLISVPDSTAGDHTITVYIAGDEASTTFTVYPEISVNPSEGESGITPIIIGTGFDNLKRANIWFYNTLITSATTDAGGSFHTTFIVPDLPAGLYYVDVEDGDNLAKARFTITAPSTTSSTPTTSGTGPTLGLDKTTGSVGQNLIVTGTGFKANTPVSLKYDGELLNAFDTDGNGFFAVAINVPSSQHGNHLITASDGTSTSEITFTVESTPPAAPTLVQPAEGISVRAPVLFAWLDVADPSLPVTYDIQIAVSSGFSGTSIALEKTGLTKPQFSLTETERQNLDMGKDEYYWRVRATDGAGNEGSWSSIGAFSLVTTAVPVWAIVVMSLIGVLLLLALGYLLRMKTGLFK